MILKNISWLVLAQGLMVAGTAITVQGQLAAGKAAKATADYNASLQDRNAKAQERKAEQIQRIFAFKAQEQEEDFKKLNVMGFLPYKILNDDDLIKQIKFKKKISILFLTNHISQWKYQSLHKAFS